MVPINQTQRSLIELNIATMLFGFSALFTHWLSVDSSWLVFGRTLFAGAALLAINLYKNISLRVEVRKLLVLVISGFVLAAHWWTFFYAMKISSVAAGLLGFALFPVMTTLLEPLIEKTNWRKIDFVTAALCCIGLVIIALTESKLTNTLVGLAWGSLSAFLFAILALMNRRLTRVSHHLNIAFYQISFACVVIALVGMSNWSSPSAKDWIGLLFLGIVFTAFAHLLYIKALSHLKVQLASIIVALEPIYGILLAMVFLAEFPGITTLIGGIFIFSAVVLAIRSH